MALDRSREMPSQVPSIPVSGPSKRFEARRPGDRPQPPRSLPEEAAEEGSGYAAEEGSGYAADSSRAVGISVKATRGPAAAPTHRTAPSDFFSVHFGLKGKNGPAGPRPGAGAAGGRSLLPHPREEEAALLVRAGGSVLPPPPPPCCQN